MKQNIPYITLTGNSSPRSDKNVFRFETVSAIIKNKDTGLYLVVEFMNNEYGLVGGGVEKGEDKQHAVIREIKEETGYSNAIIKYIVIDKIYGRGYKERKDREEESLDRVFYVEVEEKYKGKALGMDYGMEKIIWVNESRVLETLTISLFTHYFEVFLKINKIYVRNVVSICNWVILFSRSLLIFTESGSGEFT